MTTFDGRRGALRTFGLAAAGAGLAAAGGAERARAEGTATGASNLKALTAKLASIPRRRDFTTVPMILDDDALWDRAAIAEVIAYQAKPRQIWNNMKIDGPWLALMRNSLNTQVGSFRHPDFLVVSATHGTAHLALYDEATWAKYQLARYAGDKFKSNTLLAEKRTADDGAGRDGISPRDFSIATLMRRGIVFMGCHNAIWEQAGKLIKDGVNPDKLAQDALAAELTNHLVDGVVLTPGIVATIPELQQSGFLYISS